MRLRFSILNDRFQRPKTETQKAMRKLASHRRMIKRPYIEYYLGYIKFEPAADIIMNSSWLRYKGLIRFLRRVSGRKSPFIRKMSFNRST